MIDNIMDMLTKKSKEEKAKDAITGIAIGATMGALAGILLAPKAGKESREDLKEKYSEITETIKANPEEKIEEIKGLKDKLSNKLEDDNEDIEVIKEALYGRDETIEDQYIYVSTISTEIIEEPMENTIEDVEIKNLNKMDSINILDKIDDLDKMENEDASDKIESKENIKEKTGPNMSREYLQKEIKKNMERSKKNMDKAKANIEEVKDELEGIMGHAQETADRVKNNTESIKDNLKYSKENLKDTSNKAKETWKQVKKIK